MTFRNPTCRRGIAFVAALCLGLASSWPALAEDDDETGTGTVAELSAEDFLREVRRPFRQEAWGEATGSVQYVSDQHGQRRGTIRLRMTFSPDALHAQIILNDLNVYGLEQRHGGTLPAQTRVDLPEQETPPGLFDFGIQPEDLTFAFIYWDFRRELPGETFLRRPCRVMELAHPRGDGVVRVWFSGSHGYPLKAEWYETAAREPWRTLELKGAKKHDNDLWFIKEVRLDGKGWKTRVRFDHAEINPIGKEAQPAPAR